MDNYEVIGKMEEQPDWLQRLIDTLTNAWDSQGGMAAMCGQDSATKVWDICVFPGLREIRGGKEDGSQVFPTYTLQLSDVCKAFDKFPKMGFNSGQGAHPQIYLKGRIDGVKVILHIMACPPNNVTPCEVAYATGPKAGTVEPVKFKGTEEGTEE